MLRRAMTDAAPCVGRRMVASRQVARRALDGCCAGSRRMVRRGQQMVVHGASTNGLQRDSICCAVRWQVVCGEVDGHCMVSWRADGMQSARRVLRGKQADGAQRVRSADTGKPPPVMPTACAHKGMRASACIGGCCARSKRMARGGPASCQQKVPGTIFGSLEL